MGDLLNIFLPLLTTSRNYGESLSKLAGFALYEAFLIAIYLRQIPQFEQFLQAIMSFTKINNASLVACLCIALVVALLSRAFKLHDRVSDVLKIRCRFDRTHILVPLARLVDVEKLDEKKPKMKEKRHELMRAVFYKYASSRAEKPLVDRHDIEHALDAWTWFWWPVEAIIFLSIGITVALAFCQIKVAATLFGVAACFTLISMGLYNLLKQLAQPQVRAIAADPIAKDEVRAHLNAL